MSHYFLTSNVSQLITVKFWMKFIAWFHFCRRLKRTIFCKMEKNEFRADQISIYERFKKEIKAELDNIQHIWTSVCWSVYNWVNEFIWYIHIWCTSFGTFNWGCYEIIQKSSIKSTILFWLIDKWKCAKLVKTTGISHGTVISILHELSMKKLSARWVPRLLTVDHKRDRVRISKQCLKMFQHNPEFPRRFITVDETWIHYFTSETKEQSKQWISPGFHWTNSEEGEDRKVGRKGEDRKVGHSFLGCTWYKFISITFHRSKRSMTMQSYWTVSITF